MLKLEQQHIRKSIFGRSWSAALAALAVASTAAAASDKPTFNQDVAPILFAHCAGCHRAGQIGPMSLLTYKDARPWAKSIKKSVNEETMPPWFADPAHGRFKDENRLTADQKAALINWVDQGAPEGSGELPIPPEFRDNEWRMGKPDQVFAMVKPFKVEDDVEDHYEHVVIPSGLTEDKWVIGTELLPGAMDIVHHILVFVTKGGPIDEKKLEALNKDENGGGGAGDDNEMDESLITGGLFAKYGPGTNPEVWANGRGRLMPAGCNIVFQLHYHKQPGPGTAKTDVSRIAVKYAPGPVEHPLTTAWILNPTFKIPAGDENFEASSVFKFIDDGQIYALTPHLHLRGKDFHYEAIYPDGTKEILLSIPKWDFNWQISYILAEPKSIPKGTKIRAVAHWDNSAKNPHNPDPTADVWWGNPSTDEMMIGFMDYTYDNRKKSQSQYGFPEDLKINPFSLGGSPEDREKMREEMQERQKQRQERLRKRQELQGQSEKPAAGTGL